MNIATFGQGLHCEGYGDQGIIILKFNVIMPWSSPISSGRFTMSTDSQHNKPGSNFGHLITFTLTSHNQECSVKDLDFQHSCVASVTVSAHCKNRMLKLLIE